MAVETFDSVPIAFGLRLKQARTAARFTLKQAGESLGLAVSTISEIESSKRRVTAVELNRFAKLYHRPISFFFEPSEIGASFSMLLRAANAASVNKETIVRFQDLCRNYNNLRNLVGAPESPTPPDYSKAGLTSFEDAEKLAEAERSALGLDGQPIKDIYEVLEGKRGVKIFHLPEDPEILSGAFACDDELGACFLINSRHRRLRRTFTVAHEYAHCIAHRNELAHLDSDTVFESRIPRERFANAFAAAFLMPRRAANEVLVQLSSRHRTAMTAELIVRVAIYFGVSFEAAGWRLVSLRKLRADDWQALLAQKFASSPTARLLGYRNEMDNPDLAPPNYRYLAYEAHKAGLISFEKLAEFLGRNYYEFREEFSQENREDSD